ncbi:ABC transporter permease subunit [Kribbella sandramycini]|uniref:ABC transporter permease subunit n=1 Tax=Kribbella sandramycini TaxID=60450 RepID=A0A7Y4KXJ5_9ACTN|nr:ABC transporter permease subunit [Kribbella sandramycini]NOL40500.1 ABC transporter permease subunit [Kribbella sandramycini]
MGKAGWALFFLLLLVILIGPAIAPNTATHPVGPPYAPPSGRALLGTDHLGRDMLSRLLLGGRPLLLTSLAAAAAGTLAGSLTGLVAALSRRRLGAWLMRPLDAITAVPPILLLLLCLTALPNRTGLVIAVAITSAPLSARVARSAAAQVAGRAHVENAIARGENWSWLLGREILPLVAGPLLADFGIRFVAAVYLVAAAGFLGLGASDTDWGRLIVEALPGAALQPVALLAPVIGVAFLAVAANLASDRAAQNSRGLLA